MALVIEERHEREKCRNNSDKSIQTRVEIFMPCMDDSDCGNRKR